MGSALARSVHGTHLYVASEDDAALFTAGLPLGSRPLARVPMPGPAAQVVALAARVLATTAAGHQELSNPQRGLSLPQRWLLGHLDGRRCLADFSALAGCPPVERLPRDAARLAGMGLASDVGEPGPIASGFGPTTSHGELTIELPLETAPGPVRAAASRRGAKPGRQRSQKISTGSGWE